MRYFVRALKYFIYITILGALIVILFALLQGMSLDMDALFRNGSSDIYKILGIFAVVSAIYPALGYQKRSVSFSKNWTELKPEIIATMQDNRFNLSQESDGRLVFTASGGISRFLRMYEDRITIDVVSDANGGTMLLEGHRRNLLRIVYDIEALLKKKAEE